MKISLRVLSLLMLLILAAHSPYSQEYTPAQKSQTLKLLTLKRAQLQLEMRKGEFDRALKLQESGLISEQEFVQKRTAYLQAQVEYQESLISFMGSEARISVANAVKYQDESGKKFVRVSLRYSSKELKELEKLNIDAKDIFPLDFLQEIKDVYVSLRFEGKIISDPYEKTIPSLALEEEKQVTFQLLKDVENLDINIWGTNYTREEQCDGFHLAVCVHVCVFSQNYEKKRQKYTNTHMSFTSSQPPPLQQFFSGLAATCSVCLVFPDTKRVFSGFHSLVKSPRAAGHHDVE